jgi:hypothetical protein
MSSNLSLALYQALKDDLSSYLPSSVLYEDGALGPDAGPKQVAAHALLKSFFKKFKDHTKGTAELVALRKFQTGNLACRDWTLQLEDSRDECLYNGFKEAMYRFWYKNGYSLVSHHSEILDAARLGPGSNLKARSNSFYAKLFASPLTTTNPRLYRFYREHVKGNPTWWGAEFIRSFHYGDPIVVQGNMVSFVPKNEEEMRTICTEPTLNMLYQLGFGKILEDRLFETFGIDLSTQPDINRRLAYLGSVDGVYCTIDLANASNSVAIAMLEATMPKPMLNWLKLFRSDNYTLDGSRYSPFYMVSSMGNGSTFPLETIIFSCVIHTVMHFHGLKFLRNKRKRSGEIIPGNWAAFGDDLIVNKLVYKDVVRLLEILGFQVNADKSFSDGPFRESCGHDYFRGNNVRGVYIKSLERKQDLFVAINSLNTWSAKTGINLPRVVALLCERTGGWKQFLVPLHENPESGIRVPLDVTKYYYRKVVYNDSTIHGGIVYKRFVPKDLAFTVYDDAGLLAPPGTEFDGEKLVRSRSDRKSRVKYYKPLIYNEWGLFMSDLGGYISYNGKKRMVSVRHDSPLYKTKRAVTLNWDAVHPEVLNLGINSPALQVTHLGNFSLTPGGWPKGHGGSVGYLTTELTET